MRHFVYDDLEIGETPNPEALNRMLNLSGEGRLGEQLPWHPEPPPFTMRVEEETDDRRRVDR